MEQNERYYRRVIGSIGFGLLIFLLLLDLFGTFISIPLPLLLDWIFSGNEVGSTVAYQLIYGAGYLFCFMLPVAFIKLFIKRGGYLYRPMKSQLRISPLLPLILFSGIAIIFSMAFINSVFMDVIGFNSAFFTVGTETEGEPRSYELVLEFIVFCLVPGFCEEFLFRGSILTNCLPFGRGNAIMISALLFGMMHRNPAQIFYAFAAGILLGIVYERTGSIWNGVILHTLNNFVSVTEGTVLHRVKDELLAYLYINIGELILFVLGSISTVILLYLFHSKRDTRVKGGFFGKTLPASDSYAEYPILAPRAAKLFMAPSMVIFLSFCVVQVVGLILLSWVT